MTIGIYRILNTVTGKSYVGQSSNVELRWKQHLHLLRRGIHQGVKLLRSYQKHGESAFVHELLEECDISVLNDREKAWMESLEARQKGYNCCRVSDFKRGQSKSEETRKKMSEAAKKTWEREDVRQRRVATARDVSDAVKNKRRDNARRSWGSPETREAMIAGIKKAYQDPELKEKVRQSQSRSKSTAESREKQSRIAHEIYSRPGFLKKKSEMTKRDWADPEKKAIRVLKCRLTRASKKLVILKNGEQT